MDEFHGTAATHVDAPPDALFRFITDVDRLPEWNRAIESVVERPPALAPGERWTVRMHPPRVPRWGSVSTVEEYDAAAGRFTYETRNTDGNPSFVKWAWQIAADGAGSRVTVTWDCYLKTADRKHLAGPLRKRQLAREVPRSLETIAQSVRNSISS